MSEPSEQTPTSTEPTTTPIDSSIPQRDPQGNLLEPGQTATPPAATPTDTSLTAKPDGTPEPTSTSKPPEGAPETYAEFTAPEGYTIDPKTIEAAAPIFKELGLTQDQAQKLVDFHSSQMIAAAKAPATEYENTRNAWKASIEADPDIKSAALDGKTGLDAVKIGIGKTLAAIGDAQLTADFKAAMDLTGAGDNPAFIKAMWKLSALVTEGKHVAGANPSPHGQRAPGSSDRPAPAAALYPNLPR